jgi:hypothetical protein
VKKQLTDVERIEIRAAERIACIKDTLLRLPCACWFDENLLPEELESEADEIEYAFFYRESEAT